MHSLGSAVNELRCHCQCGLKTMRNGKTCSVALPVIITPAQGLNASTVRMAFRTRDMCSESAPPPSGRCGRWPAP